jgi:N-methylhydantoinase A
MTPTAAIGIDIGGTFTDVLLVFEDQSRPAIGRKVLTSVADLARSCLEGVDAVVAESGIGSADVQYVVHATTQGTNALLQRDRPPVALLTTSGFGDMAWITGTQVRDIYDLRWERWRPPLEPASIFEVTERLDAHGKVRQPVDVAEVREIAKRVRAYGAEAIAVCFLHSYFNPSHEREVRDILAEYCPGTPVVLSSDVWPHFREYDRTIMAVLSAYIYPVMGDYLNRLQDGLASRGFNCGLFVMQSNGGVLTAERAAASPLGSLESGPAAGVLAGAAVAEVLGLGDCVTFDMGGTTAKASLVVGGRVAVRSDYRVGGRVSGDDHGVLLRTSVVDVAEIGAGGGSIAWFDRGGLLDIGPHSAGAVPGPACYGRGGTEPTVTDADVVLGYLDIQASITSDWVLDRSLAEQALEPVADRLSSSRAEAAWAVHEIANVKMAEAIRQVTVAKGFNPRGMAVVGFGGAGPTHVARLAELFGIDCVVVPLQSGILSTVGLLTADLLFEASRSVWMDVDEAAGDQLDALFAELQESPVADIQESHGVGYVAPSDIAIERSVEVRRRGQGSGLMIAVPDAPAREVGARLATAYRQEYERVYGVWRGSALVIASCRVRVHGQRQGRPVQPIGARQGLPPRNRSAYFGPDYGEVVVPVHRRTALVPGSELPGPCLVDEDAGGTTVVPPQWTAVLDQSQHLLLRR